MRTRSTAVCAVSLLVGCGGSAAGWLDGKVAGNEVSVKEAIFTVLPDGEVYVAAGDQENLCAIMTGQQRPSGSMNALELYLGNWNGGGFQPLVTGTYTVTQTLGPPGLVVYPILWWLRECIPYTTLSASRGTVTVESVGLPSGGQTVVSVDLAFGAERMTGHLNASYCAPVEYGTACYARLRSSAPTLE
jgi:hypothetical protein